MSYQKIEILEGGTPFFDPVEENSPIYGLREGPKRTGVALTFLRAHNGQELVDRCAKAWDQNEEIYFEYPSLQDGITKEKALIVAARTSQTPEGDALMLWVVTAENDEDIDFDL